MIVAVVWIALLAIFTFTFGGIYFNFENKFIQNVTNDSSQLKKELISPQNITQSPQISYALKSNNIKDGKYKIKSKKFEGYGLIFEDAWLSLTDMSIVFVKLDANGNFQLIVTTEDQGTSWQNQRHFADGQRKHWLTRVYSVQIAKTNGAHNEKWIHRSDNTFLTAVVSTERNDRYTTEWKAYEGNIEDDSQIWIFEYISDLD